MTLEVRFWVGLISCYRISDSRIYVRIIPNAGFVLLHTTYHIPKTTSHTYLPFQARLGEVLESIIQLDRNETLLSGRLRSDSSYSISKVRHRYRPSPVCPSHSRIQMDSVSIRCDQLVIGALEAAFVDMVRATTCVLLRHCVHEGCSRIDSNAILNS